MVRSPGVPTSSRTGLRRRDPRVIDALLTPSLPGCFLVRDVEDRPHQSPIAARGTGSEPSPTG